METATKIKNTLDKVQEAAKRNAKADPIVYTEMAIGDYHRQGDVYFLRLSAQAWQNASIAKPERQLAPGSTQGSRHIVREADMAHLQFFRPLNPTPLDGPLIKAKKPFCVEHPEHGAVTLPAGEYQVYYQRQYAQELKRVLD